MKTFPRHLWVMLGVFILLIFGAWAWRFTVNRGLEAAIENGDEASALRYTELFADPNLLDTNELPVLTRAVANGYLNLTRALLKSGADVNAKGGQARLTPLMFACFWGRKDLAQELIAAGADVNAVGGAGQTALLWAVRGRDPSMVSFLIKAGASIDWKDSDGHTALTIAAKRGNKEAVSYLLASSSAFSREDLEEAIWIAQEKGFTNLAHQIGSNLTYLLTPIPKQLPAAAGVNR